MKTPIPKKTEIKRDFYLIDVKNKILGRVATKIASILRGKHKSYYSPHIDTGDYVVVVNASKIKVTGKKLKNKFYLRYSGYPGGLKSIPLEKMLQQKPTEIIRLAVKRMLPKNPLGRKMLKKLKVYKDEEHPYKHKKLLTLKED